MYCRDEGLVVPSVRVIFLHVDSISFNVKIVLLDFLLCSPNVKFMAHILISFISGTNWSSIRVILPIIAKLTK